MTAHPLRFAGCLFAGLVVATVLAVGAPGGRALARSETTAAGQALTGSETATGGQTTTPSGTATGGQTPTPSGTATGGQTPTPSGTAAGAAASAAPYRTVGLGDSVPSGYACGCTSYVDLVGRYAAAQRGTKADVSNLAEAGLTTSGLLGQLTDTDVRKKIAAADLVIITIGANDFDTGVVDDGLDAYRSALARQATQLSDVFRQVSALAGHATILVTGYWNVFLDGDVALARGATYVRNSDALTLAENAQIAKVGAAQGDTYVDIYTPFKRLGNDTSLLAADGDHPNAAGHRTIAKALEAAL